MKIDQITYLLLMFFIIIVFTNCSQSGIVNSNEQSGEYNKNVEHTDTLTENFDCANLTSKYLNLANVHQSNDYWCWAASGEMAMKPYNINVPQCRQVDDYIRTYDVNHQDICCDNPDTPGCAVASKPNFPFYNLLAKHDTDRPRSWEELKNLIACKESPIVFGGKPLAGGIGHMQVIIGFEEGNYRYLYVNNPSNPDQVPSLITYDEYANPFNGRHTEDYYDFAL